MMMMHIILYILCKQYIISINLELVLTVTLAILSDFAKGKYKQILN